MITPTVGRVVHFYPGEFEPYHDQAPLCALICHVWSDTCVNLAVFDPNGFPQPHQSVQLVQPGEARVDDASSHCRWMPYQTRKATGSESGEQAAGTQAI